MIKRKIRLPIKITLRLLACTIIFIALFFIIGYAGKILKNSDYFKTKDIIVNKGKKGFDTSTAPKLAFQSEAVRAAQYHPEQSRRIDFSYLVGYNIFDIDLKSEAKRISELYPSYCNVRLVMVPPNRLFIGFTEREPLAYVKLYRYFAIDKDSVLLDTSAGLSALELPVILGLERKIFGAKAGRQYNIKELALALNIIREIKIDTLLKNYKVQKIDVTNPVNVSCFLIPLVTLGYPQDEATGKSNEIEVRISEDNVRDKIEILAGLLSQLKADPGNIKYIDLRFKEPVIKFKRE